MTPRGILKLSIFQNFRLFNTYNLGTDFLGDYACGLILQSYLTNYMAYATEVEFIKFSNYSFYKIDCNVVLVAI